MSHLAFDQQRPLAIWCQKQVVVFPVRYWCVRALTHISPFSTRSVLLLDRKLPTSWVHARDDKQHKSVIIFLYYWKQQVLILLLILPWRLLKVMMITLIHASASVLIHIRFQYISNRMYIVQLNINAVSLYQI